jgi:hypothetical protein
MANPRSSTLSAYGKHFSAQVQAAECPVRVDAVEKVGGFRLGWAFDAVGLMCG